MNWIEQIDTALLRVLNVQCANPVFDRLLPLFSRAETWMIPLIGLALFIVLRERRRGIFILVGIGLTLLLSETMSTWVMKELIERARPCHIHEWVRLMGYCPKSPSFTSTHAANSFAAATFLAFFFPRWRFPMLGVAVLIGYFRIYKGVHYPLDVLGGAILGAGCAWAVFLLFRDLILPRFGITLRESSKCVGDEDL